MRQLLATILFFVALALNAQTNVINVPVADYTGTGQTNFTVTFTLLSPNPRTVNALLITQKPMVKNSGTSTNVSFTNVIWGKYRCEVSDSTVTPYTFYVGTNTLGNWQIAALITNSAAVPPNDGTNYYTKAQTDALLAGISSGTGTTYTNNSAIQGAGVIVGSGIGTKVTLAQLPSAVVTNGQSSLILNGTNATFGLPNGDALTIIGASSSAIQFPFSVERVGYSDSIGRFSGANYRAMGVFTTNVNSGGMLGGYAQLGVSTVGNGTLTLANFDSTILINLSSTSGSGTFPGSVTASNFLGDGSALTGITTTNLVGLITTPQLVASNLVTYALTNLVTTNTAGITRQGNNQVAVSTNYDGLGTATASTNGLPAKVWTLGNLSQSNYISGTSQTNVTFVASTFSGDGNGLTNLNAATITGNFWVRQSSGFFGYTNAAAIGSGAPGGGLRLVGNSADSRALIVATNYASLGSIALLTKGSLYFDTDNASSSYLFYVNGSLSTIIGSSLITLYKNVSCLSNLTATTITATNGHAFPLIGTNTFANIGSTNLPFAYGAATNDTGVAYTNPTVRFKAYGANTNLIDADITAGTFSGNGGGLTNVAASIVTGTNLYLGDTVNVGKLQMKNISSSRTNQFYPASDGFVLDIGAANIANVLHFNQSSADNYVSYDATGINVESASSGYIRNLAGTTAFQVFGPTSSFPGSMYYDFSTAGGIGDVHFRDIRFGYADAFTILGTNGYVGINTNSPKWQLDVLGTNKATQFVGGGVGISNVVAASFAALGTNATAANCLNVSTTAITNSIPDKAVQVTITVTVGTIGFFNTAGFYEGGQSSVTETLSRIIPKNGYITNSAGTLTVNAAGAL